MRARDWITIGDKHNVCRIIIIKINVISRIQRIIPVGSGSTVQSVYHVLKRSCVCARVDGSHLLLIPHTLSEIDKCQFDRITFFFI